MAIKKRTAKGKVVKRKVVKKVAPRVKRKSSTGRKKGKSKSGIVNTSGLPK
jgi:hypothetical protein